MNSRQFGRIFVMSLGQLFYNMKNAPLKIKFNSALAFNLRLT